MAGYPGVSIIPMGSSLKLCLVAEGKADLYPRLGPTSEWDTAAAQAIVEAAGGQVVALPEATPLCYNKHPDTLLNPHFLVCGQPLTNVYIQHLDINKTRHAQIKKQAPCVLWFTGLSGSGKSTTANALEQRLHQMGYHTYILDGDNVRHGLNKDLGFTDADRIENIRRITEVAKLMVDAGLIVLTAFISPFQEERRMARSLFDEGEFIEVFVDAPLEVAEARDPKGLYKKARSGQLKNFTGIDSSYEPPEKPELHLDTAAATVEQLVEQVMSFLVQRNIVHE